MIIYYCSKLWRIWSFSHILPALNTLRYRTFILNILIIATFTRRKIKNDNYFVKIIVINFMLFIKKFRVHCYPFDNYGSPYGKYIYGHTVWYRMPNITILLLLFLLLYSVSSNKSIRKRRQHFHPLSIFYYLNLFYWLLHDFFIYFIVVVLWPFCYFHVVLIGVQSSSHHRAPILQFVLICQ